MRLTFGDWVLSRFSCIVLLLLGFLLPSADGCSLAQGQIVGLSMQAAHLWLIEDLDGFVAFLAWYPLVFDVDVLRLGISNRFLEPGYFGLHLNNLPVEFRPNIKGHLDKLSELQLHVLANNFKLLLSDLGRLYQQPIRRSTFKGLFAAT